MIISYFDGLSFGAADRVPHCTVWIDRVFPTQFAINYAHRGAVEWQSDDGQSTWIDAPALFWTWPGRRFRYGARARAAAWDQSYVTYSGPRAERMARAGLSPRRSDPWITGVDPDSTRRAFDALLGALHQPLPAVERAVHLLEGLFLAAQFAPAQVPGPERTAGSSIESLRERIVADPSRNWSARNEADRLGLSPVHMRRIFSQQTGVPFHRFVISARLQHAAALLRRTDLPIKRVALQSGYGDVPHFHKAFVAQHGRSPLVYRKQAQAFGSRR